MPTDSQLLKTLSDVNYLETIGKKDKALEMLRNLSLSGMYADIYNFHQKFGQPCPDSPTLPDLKTIELRRKLIIEEAKEVDDELVNGDLNKIAHECIDLIVVAMGTLVACGVQPSVPWQMIQEANMRKIPNPTGGKILKPEGWVKADITPAIEAQKMVNSGNGMDM